jgi:hypothetical protein
MDCNICGRPVIVEHLETKPEMVHCEPCAAHRAEKCWPRCTACRIVAMTGYNMGQVRRLNADEIMCVMWHFEKTDIVWQSVDGHQLTIVSPEISIEAYGLMVDEKGWCKRRH